MTEISKSKNFTIDFEDLVQILWSSVNPAVILTQNNITSTNYTFQWDGKINTSTYAPAGTYTYEVIATQTDVNTITPIDPNGTPRYLSLDDHINYRSTYLSILRTTDGNGNAVCDAEYVGYDDNGTPNEADDNYIYYIKDYTLKDAGNVNACSGVVLLFDPDINPVYNWDVADQECLLHSSTNGGKDGLYATTAGLNHKLKLKVPIAKMEYAGDYRFVLHVEDNHAIDYRNHNIEPIENANRPALELNQVAKTVGMAVFALNESWTGIERSPTGINAYRRLFKIGYRPWGGKIAGDLHSGASGFKINANAHEAVHTLNTICDDCPNSLASRGCHGNAIWVYYGHGTLGGLAFSTSKTDWTYISNTRDYNINNIDVSFIRVAYLQACASAGIHAFHNNQLLDLSIQDSISTSFVNKGADVAIGFYNLVYPTFENFKRWSRDFWYKMSVGGNVRSAYNYAQENVDENDVIPDPKIIGNDQVKIVPAQYGN